MHFLPFFIYLVASTGIGVISIASAPGGDNHILPHSLSFYLLPPLFFSKGYWGGKTTSGPLIVWGILVFSTLLAKPGMDRCVGQRARPLSSVVRDSSLRLRRRK